MQLLHSKATHRTNKVPIKINKTLWYEWNNKAITRSTLISDQSRANLIKKKENVRRIRAWGDVIRDRHVPVQNIEKEYSLVEFRIHTSAAKVSRDHRRSEGLKIAGREKKRLCEYICINVCIAGAFIYILGEERRSRRNLLTDQREGEWEVGKVWENKGRIWCKGAKICNLLGNYMESKMCSVLF